MIEPNTHPTNHPEHGQGFLPAIDLDGQRFIVLDQWFFAESEAAAYAGAICDVLEANLRHSLELFGFEALNEI